MPNLTLGILGEMSIGHKQKISFSANFLRGRTLAPSAPAWSRLWRIAYILPISSVSAI
jgi:hypothetical protein